jgi:SpoVK/Ycf46/Vps4 family AAA+-type ATPase
MQCKERVDLLEALKQSREDKTSDTAPTPEPAGKIVKPPSRSRPRSSEVERSEPGYIGNGTIPAVNYPDLSRPRPPPPPLPQRPSIAPRRSSERAVVGGRLTSLQSYTASPSKDVTLSSSPSLAPPPKRASRSPSPEKGRTMLHTLRGSDRSRKKSNPKSEAKKPEMSVTNKAASMAWQSVGKRGRDKLGRSQPELVTSNSALSDSSRKGSSSDPLTGMPGSSSHVRYDNKTRTLVPDSSPKPHSQTDLLKGTNQSVGATDPFNAYPFPPSGTGKSSAISGSTATSSALHDLVDLDPLTLSTSENIPRRKRTPPPPPPPLRSKPKFEPVSYPTYLREYPETGAKKKAKGEGEEVPLRRKPVIKESTNIVPSTPSSRLSRKPIAGDIRPKSSRVVDAKDVDTSSVSFDDDTSSEGKAARSKMIQKQKQKGKQKQEELVLADPTTPSDDSEDSSAEVVRNAWKERTVQLLKNLPTGIDDVAAKQILNEIVVQGDVVHWGDIAGLEIAKKSLKEAVVYPFLRPDLFMGLREPARGMLLFGPPGTGKTMLARAVATESKSTFFSISASSLISKYLGESEKLVRALFALAKALAPSIIFVDEIDSLLSARSGSGEHETTRRIKTEFLIQWSDLQRAAAGREQSEKDKEKGDASRVLVLAATNLPWAIDEAARRRFVRRQYIPLPEDETRATQLRTLLGHQKHSLDEADIQKLVVLTDGASFLSGVTISYSPHIQGSPGLTLQHWPRMRQWDPYGLLVKLYFTCPWIKFVQSSSTISRLVSSILGQV